MHIVRIGSATRAGGSPNFKTGEPFVNVIERGLCAEESWPVPDYVCMTFANSFDQRALVNRGVSIYEVQ